MIKRRMLSLSFLLVPLALGMQRASSAQETLPGTRPLTMQGDLAAQMVAGIDRYLMRETEVAAKQRASRWKRDTSSPDAYVRSIEPNRERFKRILGLVDAREPANMYVVAPAPGPVELARSPGYKVYTVRWSVLKGVDAEGLLLVPDKKPVADVIALPDCDWSPEQLVGLADGVPKEAQFARRLAESGCRVLVPVLIDRRDTFTSTSSVRPTNLPHREYIWRAAYEMGRTMIGYEVQKVLAAVDWFKVDQGTASRPIGVIGYGEGGLIALYSAACDTRIDHCIVSGYFGPREGLWSEPIYRNVYGLLPEYGDAEIASLIVPRRIVVDAADHPAVSGPPQTAGKGGAAPGAITTPSFDAVYAEGARLQKLAPPRLRPSLMTVALVKSRKVWQYIFIPSPGQKSEPVEIKRLTPDPLLSVVLETDESHGRNPSPMRTLPDPADRMKRQFDQLVDHTQALMRESPARRAEFWKQADASSVEKWQASTRAYRDKMWDDLVGRLPAATLPANARTRVIYDTPKVRAYEVVMDVYPDVFAYGILLLPKDIMPGEKRPVVVCQHGLEGRPQDVADPNVDNPAYHRYAYRLAAERGFITYAPQNPYIGQDKFRVLLRKAQPLGLTLFSFIVRQHEQTLNWLKTLPNVDPARIAFYGLSYGGKTAMRVPALLGDYCLSICSADYNEWVWKNASATSPYSYLVTGEYDMPEWNLANTFNYAEMSWLICPRPFMVERGHDDGVAPDEWVAHEFARTRRRYDLLGIGDRTTIEFFNGPHTINGVGTFDFLHKHLQWPKPQDAR
jgi:dienelactone hydrolase